MKRRDFLRYSTMTGAGLLAGFPSGMSCSSGNKSTFNVCLNPDALDAEPELLNIVQDAGITDIWLAGFLFGYWPYSLERIKQWQQRILKTGTECHIITVPLGHPGDALGSTTEDSPVTPPKHWKIALSHDGKKYVGTSLHEPATSENVQAIQKFQELGIKKIMLDDDFRLAKYPGIIGGCFCDFHQKQFLDLYGYNKNHWIQLLDSVNNRDLSPVLRSWIDFTCDQLTECFRAQQNAAPDIQLGNMVMYLGAEKAGIRLKDYQGVPLRVGELMFNDKSFAPVKGKTNELFSSLFHRRFVSPELAYSETTAFPADQLSAPNMAAKLAVSLFSDVRNTMFMSGLTPFPRTHWQILAPAMKKQAAIRKKIANLKPQGPFKHYWGEYSRMVGNDKPYSLFLSAGVPFEVTEEPARDGWTFLAEFDAKAAATGNLKSNGTTFIYEQKDGYRIKEGLAVSESLPEIFALKQKLRPQLKDVPIVEEDTPVVCAWYPTARSVLLWNLEEKPKTLTITYKGNSYTKKVKALDVELLQDIG